MSDEAHPHDLWEKGAARWQDAAVKKHRRSAAGQGPTDPRKLRTDATLGRAVQFILDHVVDADTQPSERLRRNFATGGTSRGGSGNNNNNGPDALDMWLYAWDRLRAVRVDYAEQHFGLFGERCSRTCIAAFEKIASMRQQGQRCVLLGSAIEFYLGECFDLLSSDKRYGNAPVVIREDGSMTFAWGFQIADAQVFNECGVTVKFFPTVAPVICTCTTDLDGNCEVNGADLAILLGQWATAGDADVDGSGSVDGADLALLLGEWNNCGDSLDP